MNVACTICACLRGRVQVCSIHNMRMLGWVGACIIMYVACTICVCLCRCVHVCSVHNMRILRWVVHVCSVHIMRVHVCSMHNMRVHVFSMRNMRVHVCSAHIYICMCGCMYEACTICACLGVWWHAFCVHNISVLGWVGECM